MKKLVITNVLFCFLFPAIMYAQLPDNYLSRLDLTKPAESDTFRKKVVINLESSPAGAIVYLDNSFFGYTPLEIEASVRC